MTNRWDPEKIELMQEAHTWKRRAQEAEAKIHGLLQRQDEMAAQIEELLKKLHGYRNGG